MIDFSFEKEGFYRIIPMKEFRRTPGVEFHILTKESIPRVDGVDRVIHESDALSPGPIDQVSRPWYVHPHQDDNLMVLSGERTVDIFHLQSMTMLTFLVTPDEIYLGDLKVCSEPAILVWPRGVFHRIKSGTAGSASLNLATRYEGFDINTNFSIWDLDTKTGNHHLLREGKLDQT